MTQTIEQLTARVRELEEENARWKNSFERTAENTKTLLEQLAASQLHVEQLREALEGLKPLAAYGRVGTRDVEQAEFQRHLEALSIPRDTSALDAYVAKRLHDMACDKGLLRIQVEELTRQRDLAVESLRKCRYRSLVDKVVDDALEAIKESEAK